MPDPSRAESIVNRARALDGNSRDKYLDSACGSDDALRNKVEALLREGSAHTSDSKETLLPPVHDVGMPRLDAGPAHEAPGSMIGPYKLLQQLGEGGFGTVFMAAQETPVARRVALKIIKLGMDTKQVVARFEQERQALAMMDHPNIAKVFDAGATTTGRPYFVMELCKGEPITDYCNKASLSIADRLALFVQVCQAVQHAHLKGLIHRDIKPSNVLVADQDGKPSAKVIDFGIAKATAHKLTEKTLFTEQAQMIGTPEYMSPEQAEGSLDIDTRTDIYALGVLLYELLTGMTPFDAKRLRSVAYAEIQRIIREVEPPHPSTRLSDVGRGSAVESRESIAHPLTTHDPRLTLETLAKSRSIEPQRLVKMLRGELDWIVMKALEKDRRRRYETATGLGLDIQRYLAGEAVEAAPPSKAYRLKKFIVRNKGPVVAASLVTIALVGGLIGTSYGLRQAVIAREAESTARKNAETQRTIAEAQRDKAEHIAAFMSETLSGVGPSVALGRDVKMLKEMMDGAAARIDKGELKKVPDTELALRNTIGRVYTDIAQYPEATRMLEPAVAQSRALHSGDDPTTANAIYAFGVLRHKQGDLQSAEPLLREALAMRARLFPGDNDGVASVQNDLAVLLEDSGRNPEAEKNYRAALDMRRRLFPGDHRDVAVSLNSMARVLKVSGNPVEAERLLRESLEMQKRLFKGDHPDLAIDIANLAITLQDRGDLAGAEPLYRESIAMMHRLFAGDNPLLASTMRNLARTLQNRGDMDGAEPLYRDAIAMNRRLLPGDSLSAAADYQNLGMFLQARGNLADAEPAFRASLEMNRRLIKVDHPNIAAVLNNLAFILLARGDAAGAEPLAREAVAMGERLNGKDDFITANSRLKLGRALLGMKRFADAETELIETERVMATAKNVPPSRRAQAAEALVELYKSWDAAEPEPGHAAKVAEWSEKLAARRPATRPATSNPTPNR